MDRSCYSCGSTKTRFNGRGIENWYLNHDIDENVLCRTCWERLILPRRKRNHAQKYLDSNGKAWYICWLRRVGICNYCCAVSGVNCNKTQWHHERGFFIIFPWFGIIELCVSCHTKEQWRLGEFRRKYIPGLRHTLLTIRNERGKRKIE